MKLRHRDINSLTQGHIAVKWQSQDLYPSLLTSKPMFLNTIISLFFPVNFSDPHFRYRTGRFHG